MQRDDAAPRWEGVPERIAGDDRPEGRHDSQDGDAEGSDAEDHASEHASEHAIEHGRLLGACDPLCCATAASPGLCRPNDALCEARPPSAFGRPHGDGGDSASETLGDPDGPPPERAAATATAGVERHSRERAAPTPSDQRGQRGARERLAPATAERRPRQCTAPSARTDPHASRSGDAVPPLGPNRNGRNGRLRIDGNFF